MLGERGPPAATVEYTDSDGEVHTTLDDVAASNGEVETVTLSYHCPFCDGPNDASFETPLEPELTITCNHCEYKMDLFKYAESGPLATLDGFKAVPDAIEDFRDIRLGGERDDSMSVTRFRARRVTAVLLGLLGVGVIIAPSSMFFFGLESASTLVTYGFFLAAALSGAAGALAYSFGRCWGLETGHGWWQPVLYKNTELYERGLRRQETEEALDPPMYSDDTERTEE